MRRHGVWPRTRRVERARRAGHPYLPIHLRVVRLEILIRDWPIGEASAGQGALHARFLEIDLAKSPEVRREMDARAADAACVDERRLLHRLVLFRLAKGVR